MGSFEKWWTEEIYHYALPDQDRTAAARLGWNARGARESAAAEDAARRGYEDALVEMSKPQASNTCQHGHPKWALVQPPSIAVGTTAREFPSPYCSICAVAEAELAEAQRERDEALVKCMAQELKLERLRPRTYKCPKCPYRYSGQSEHESCPNDGEELVMEPYVRPEPNPGQPLLDRLRRAERLIGKWRKQAESTSSPKQGMWWCADELEQALATKKEEPHA